MECKNAAQKKKEVPCFTCEMVLTSCATHPEKLLEQKWFLRPNVISSLTACHARVVRLILQLFEGSQKC